MNNHTIHGQQDGSVDWLYKVFLQGQYPEKSAGEDAAVEQAQGRKNVFRCGAHGQGLGSVLRFFTRNVALGRFCCAQTEGSVPGPLAGSIFSTAELAVTLLGLLCATEWVLCGLATYTGVVEVQVRFHHIPILSRVEIQHATMLLVVRGEDGPKNLQIVSGNEPLTSLGDRISHSETSLERHAVCKLTQAFTEVGKNHCPLRTWPTNSTGGGQMERNMSQIVRSTVFPEMPSMFVSY